MTRGFFGGFPGFYAPPFKKGDHLGGRNWTFEVRQIFRPENHSSSSWWFFPTPVEIYVSPSNFCEFPQFWGWTFQKVFDKATTETVIFFFPGAWISKGSAKVGKSQSWMPQAHQTPTDDKISRDGGQNSKRWTLKIWPNLKQMGLTMFNG